MARNTEDAQYFLDHVQPVALKFRKCLSRLQGFSPADNGSQVIDNGEPRLAPLPDPWARFDVGEFKSGFESALDAAKNAADMYLEAVKEFQEGRSKGNWA